MFTFKTDVDYQASQNLQREFEQKVKEILLREKQVVTPVKQVQTPQ